jgi:hydroxyacylglutathione hydrolase
LNVILRDLYHQDLAQASYLVGCMATGEAMIIDPNRDIQQYLDLAEREGLRIAAITETHIHADYVSGARELAARTGAKLYLSKEGTADWQYGFAESSNATLIGEGDTISIGRVKVEVLHTPGHTPEHISFLVTDGANADQPMGIFTGDFIFVGDVGRPDLLEKAAGYANTMEAGGRELFESLERIKEMPDYLQIWPGHGAGSPCGKSLGAVPQTTIGYERLFNWAFQADTADQFVQAVLADQPEPPVYFAQMKRVNKVGPAMLDELADPTPKSLEDLERALSSGETVVDVRDQSRYAEQHIPGTINIPFSKGFVTWAGWLLPYDEPFHIIAEPARLAEINHELRMIGLDTLTGYWSLDIFEQWAGAGHELGTVDHISVDTIDELGDYEVIDVRGATEHAESHIPGSTNIPLGYVRDRLDEVPEDKPVVFQCQTGRRSAIATSLAKAAGRTNVHNLTGGFDAWEESDRPVEARWSPQTVAS